MTLLLLSHVSETSGACGSICSIEKNNSRFKHNEKTVKYFNNRTRSFTDLFIRTGINLKRFVGWWEVRMLRILRYIRY